MRLKPSQAEPEITLVTSLPKCCPICGLPFELPEFSQTEFEAFRVAFCANGGHIFQKVTVEAALLAADAVGSDLRSWLDKK